MAWAYGRLEELLAARGLKVQLAKSLCYAPVAIRHRLAPELVQGAMCRMGAPVGGALEIVVAGGVDGHGVIISGPAAGMAGSAVKGFGVDMYGVPVGEAGYVSAVLDARLMDAESKLKILREKLCNVGFNDQARALNHFCCAPLLDHLMQCCYPSDTEPFLKRFDRLILLNYNLITGVDFVGEDRAVAAEDIRHLKRLRLAARFRGGGLRARGGWLGAVRFILGRCQPLPPVLR